jgi:thiamine pyrophosphate-dependent acetolactate synthase large subunit-like protein
MQRDCQVVGNRSFMCAASSSVLWVVRKYKIPILTVVLNNGGKSLPKHGSA